MELVSDPADGANGVETYLSAYGVTFLEVFEDWLVANYLDASEGRYGYPGSGCPCAACGPDL